MKIAAFLATLVVRLLGVSLLFQSITGLLALLDPGSNLPGGSALGIVLVFKMGLGAATVVLAGRVVRLFTADAPYADE